MESQNGFDKYTFYLLFAFYHIVFADSDKIRRWCPLKLLLLFIQQTKLPNTKININSKLFCFPIQQIPVFSYLRFLHHLDFYYLPLYLSKSLLSVLYSHQTSLISFRHSQNLLYYRNTH